VTQRNVEFINDLKDYDISAYTAITERYIDYASHNKAVLAVYQIGSTNNPGISDIDLVVVVENVFDPESLDSLKISRFENSEPARDLFIHDIYLYDRESFKTFRYTVHAQDLHLLWGTPLEVEDIHEEDMEALSLQNIFDFISSRLIQFYQFLSGGKLSLRGTIVRVSSIKHSYDLLKRVGIVDHEMEAFIRAIYEMRENAYTIHSQELLSIFLDSFKQFSRLVWLAGTCFREHFLPCYETVGLGNSMKLNPHFLMRFVGKITELNPPTRTDPTILYPDVVYYHYRAIAQWENAISLWARNILSGNRDEYYDLDVLYVQTLKKRIEAMALHYEFLSANRITYAMRGYPGFAVDT